MHLDLADPSAAMWAPARSAPRRRDGGGDPREPRGRDGHAAEESPARGGGLPGRDLRPADRLGLRQRQPRHAHRGRQPLLAPVGPARAALPARGGRRGPAGQRGAADAQAAPRRRVRAVPGPDADADGLAILRRPRPGAPRPRVHADHPGLRQGRRDPDAGADDDLRDAHPELAGGRRAGAGGHVRRPGRRDVPAQPASRRRPDRRASSARPRRPARTSCSWRSAWRWRSTAHSSSTAFAPSCTRPASSASISSSASWARAAWARSTSPSTSS